MALVAGLVLVAPREARGQDLTSPPVLVSLSVLGDASPGSSVTLTWHLTSEAGVSSTSLWLQRPDQTPYACFGTPALVSGSATDGGWAQSCFIWPNSISGTYSAVLVATDTAGNTLATDPPCDYSIYQCNPLFPFSVEGGPDAGKPPVVVSFSANPSAVTAGSSVTLSWHVTSPSPVQSTGAYIVGPDGATLDYCRPGQSTLVSGSPTDGVWTHSCQIAPGSVSGTYSVDIRATDPAGNEAESGGTFAVDGIPPPAITSFTPTGGAAGSIIDILGSHFSRVTNVTFSGWEASYTIASDSEIRATVPSGILGNGPISVSTPELRVVSSAYFAAVPPTIYGPIPASGPPGTTVLIFGANYANVTSVTFNGTNASYTWADGNRIYAAVPAGATTGPISVTMSSGTATSAASFTVTPVPPTMTAFTPASGPAGSTVDIQGAGFTGATIVTLNGTKALYTVDSDSHLHATVPACAATGPISVTAAGGTTTSSASFTVPPPTISGFSPTSGKAGQQVTIAGSNFSCVTAVKLGATSARITSTSPTRITAVVPNISRSNYKWSVTTSSASATTTASFQIR
jgi:hypothetical protein